MKAELYWDDLALFSAVARNGALQKAADQTGTSPATLSRRMKSLEARMGRRLFRHGRDGYALTGDGRELLSKAQRMEAAAADITHWQTATTGPVRVRISAGTWTSLRLCDALGQFWSADQGWVPEFLHCNLDMDIARREIDIGIRNRRPTQPWLAGRRTAMLQYAVYARDPSLTGGVGLGGEAGETPSAQYVNRTHGDCIITTANDPRLALGLAANGVGRMVLPTLVGDAHSQLSRQSSVIAELTSEEWLVSHHEGRHEPAIRAALRALGGFLSGPDQGARHD